MVLLLNLYLFIGLKEALLLLVSSAFDSSQALKIYTWLEMCQSLVQ